MKSKKLIGLLPPKMAAAFRLSRLQHLPNDQIAEELNISEKTVRNLLSEANKILKPRVGLGIVVFLTHFM